MRILTFYNTTYLSFAYVFKTPKITDEKKCHFLQSFVIIEVSFQAVYILYRISLNKYIMFTVNTLDKPDGAEQ